MQAVGYCRVSTEEQATEGVSLAAQHARITAWCAANGHELAEVLTDGGVSGKHGTHRAALQDALAKACAQKAVLVVYSISRMARSNRELLEIVELLGRSGANLVSLTEAFDTTSASGKMIFGILAVLAEFERNLIVERVRAAMAYKRTRGERISRYSPYGKTAGPDGHLVDDPAELAIVAEAHELAAAGLGVRAIARELTARGRPTKAGGAVWSHRVVARFLKRSA
jgi:DNA invertase Pin-like site-specific DNA recombinase